MTATTPKPERKANAGTVTGGGECLKTDWQTPAHLLDAVRAYWGGRIPFDAATTHRNPTRADKFCAPPGPSGRWDLGAGGGGWVYTNGLATSWVKAGGRAFVNPPYGKVLRDWLAKMREEAAAGCEIVALLPAARWEQAYLTDALREANAVCWIRKRVSFINPATGDAVGGNPYANLFLGFRVTPWRWRQAFGGLGACFEWRAL